MAESIPTSVRQSELHGRLVLDIETTEELGHLSQFLVDVKNHQIEGFLCRRGMLGLDTVPVMWVQVESVGRDSILVRRSDSAITERLDAALALERQSIWADSGDHVGQLADYCMDLKTGAVIQYLFSAPGWQGLTEGLHTFQPKSVVSTGRKRMMVRQSALKDAPQFVPGVQERVTETLQKDADQTWQDVQGAIDSTREAAEQMQQQTSKLRDQARSQVGQLFGQVKQRSKRLRSQVNERFADAAENLQTPNRDRQKQVPGDTIDVDSEEVWADDDFQQ